jgi:putative toxin-antitoxin system antitoxin component (TIGR02293 family)|tara:strand:- start:6661 stop:7098 length:438 start_codon:yes stop_codon:yes gene_type:complete
MRALRPAAKPLNGVLAGIGLPSRGQPLIDAVKAGLATTHYKQIAVLMGVSPLRLGQCLGIPNSTFYRRLKRGRFSSGESDKVVRAALVFEKAVGLFEYDQSLARCWIQTPQKGLNGQTPVQCFRTGVECQAVGDLIGRLEMGVFS